MAYASGNGCTENKNIQERMVQHTMRKNRLLTVMMTAALAATAFAGCGSNEVATGAKPAVTESKTSETTETEAAETEQAYDPDDNTLYHLMSDPNFDMDNAIKDEEEMEHRKLYSRGSNEDKEVLYNIMDGNRYMELTGATVIEVNKTFTPKEDRETIIGMYLENGSPRVYKHLAYYGINGISKKEFHLIDTTKQDYGTEIWEYNTVTVLRAYTSPEDLDTGYEEPGTEFQELTTVDCEGMLCEIEADGEPGYAILPVRYLGIDTDNE